MSAPERFAEEECGRCHKALGDQRFSLKVGADPPLMTPIEVWVCERCMESLTRWMERQRREPRELLPDRVEDEHPERSRRSRKKRTRRSVYSDVLDDNERWIHRHNWIIIWITLGSVIAIAGLVYFAATVDAVVTFRRH